LEPTIGFCRAVGSDEQVFVSATAAIWPDGHVDPDVAYRFGAVSRSSKRP